MSSLIRPRLLAAAALLLVLGGAWQYFGAGNKANGSVVASTAATTQAQKESSVFTPVSANSGSHDLILGSKDSAQPKNMEEFLTGVIKDVDAYWTKVFKDSNLPEPKVSYKWIPEGQTAASACGDADGTLGDSAAAYCQGDDTMYISLKFATDIYNGTLDQVLPGSSQGYGRTAGDFSVAYIVAHEYGHEVQDELGLFEKYGNQLPTMAFELQADCYSGTWAQSAYKENRLEDGDVQEALDSALAVGDFDADQPATTARPSSVRRPGRPASTQATRPRAASTWTRPLSVTAAAAATARRSSRAPAPISRSSRTRATASRSSRTRRTASRTRATASPIRATATRRNRTRRTAIPSSRTRATASPIRATAIRSSRTRRTPRTTRSRSAP